MNAVRSSRALEEPGAEGPRLERGSEPLRVGQEAGEPLRGAERHPADEMELREPERCVGPGDDLLGLRVLELDRLTDALREVGEQRLLAA